MKTAPAPAVHTHLSNPHAAPNYIFRSPVTPGESHRQALTLRYTNLSIYNDA